jgi:hypothetical protein
MTANLFARMFECNVRYAKFKVVSGPVLKLGFLFGPLLGDVEVGEEHERRVAGDEDEDVPYAVHVREADGEPRVAEGAVHAPAEHREEAHCHAPQPQPVHARTFHPVIRFIFILKMLTYKLLYITLQYNKF